MNAGRIWEKGLSLYFFSEKKEILCYYYQVFTIFLLTFKLNSYDTYTG